MFRGSDTWFKPSNSFLVNPPASNNATDIGSASYAFRTLYLGTSLSYSAAFTIGSGTSDGSDTLAAYLCGGGSGAASRGSYVALFGNEHGNAGTLQLFGGAVSGGHIALLLGHSSAKIRLYNASTNIMWEVDNSGHINQNSSNGGHIYFYRSGYGVRSYNIALTLGADTSHDTIMVSNGSTLWTFGSNGTLTQNASNGGNLVFGKSSTGIVFTADNAVSAAGSSASDATVLTKNINFVSTVAASTGVKLWDGGAGFGPIVVRNGGANTLTVYAPTGHTINGSGNSQTCSTTQTIIYFQVSSTNWVALKA